jgi:Plasmid pRiA4b ORF-3-like protein
VIDAGGVNDFASARKVKLSRFVQAGVKKFRYIYDMGDNWEHVIQVEKVLEVDPLAKYPRCLEGERACPPEDCGGPWGYADFLAAIVDPQHEQHEEMLEWRGPFDPEAFDSKKATNEMRKVK